MENSKKYTVVGLLVILCLVIGLIACLFWVRSLSARIEDLEYEGMLLSHDVDYLERKVDRLEDDLDQLILESTSLVETLDYHILGLGSQPNTAAYQLTLTPKELGEDTAVTVSLGGTTVPFSRSGDTFKGTVEIPMFGENEDHLLLTVTTAGISKRDELEEISLIYAFSDLLPQLFQSMSGTGSNADPELTDAYLGYGLRRNDRYTNAPVEFTKITMTKTVNGKEEPTQDVTHRFQDNGAYMEFTVDMPVRLTDQVTVVIRAEDSLGYIHELTSRCRCEEEHGCMTVTGDDHERIYGPDGTLLYAFDTLELP